MRKRKGWKGSKIFSEFEQFAVRGNALDMAVAIIIGAAFSKIISSLTADILMPPLGFLIGNLDFSNIFICISGGSYSTLAAAKAAGAITINIGVFINTVIDFVIMAFAMFMLVKFINRVEPQKPPAEPDKKIECPWCLTMIPERARRCFACGQNPNSIWKEDTKE